MNLSLTNFHNRRFEWVFQAKTEFIQRFAGKAESSTIIKEVLQTELESPEVNELSVNRLTIVYKEADEARKLELEQYKERMKQQDELITNQQLLLDRKVEEAEAQYNQISKNIEVYEAFLKKVELKNMDPDYIGDLVNDIIEYTPHHRKASVINDDVLRLQEMVASELENKFRRIKQEAGMLKMGISHLLEIPYLPPIPRVEQKIDAFWLKSTYEKTILEIRAIAYEWVTEMYHNYNLLLTPIFKAAFEQKDHFFQEAEALKLVTTEKTRRLERDLANYQKVKAELDARYQNVHQLWNQDREHALQLQGCLIKYWLEYKEELQRHFHYGNAEERWLAAKYLQLLRQDGEKLIKSLHE
ncbi:hypothetical protein J1P26_03635 [Neobacillus sp. MM2021_6]|uniref:hypothetical protein n=1 Tax=Bacillaceae TaxID=186817 RepID=UPI00140844BB|nr:MULTISPECIES: hypothetical protein [Bacillaceae]MBO0958814.1 hypothetical protein [Neobacillus sp. MM2021_6]NHC20039.1 hypothetical protein [Bacillus sp. MM2020_4]